MSENDQSAEFTKFLITITNIEKQREFDRQIDRLKKSSAATTFWAVIPGLLGIHGIGHFYLNRPLEGIIILIVGFIPSLFLTGFFSILTLPGIFPYWGGLPYMGGFDSGLVSSVALIFFGIIRLGFFVGNIISARYYYSRYESYINYKAKKPWNCWGLHSKI